MKKTILTLFGALSLGAQAQTFVVNASDFGFQSQTAGTGTPAVLSGSFNYGGTLLTITGSPAVAGHSLETFKTFGFGLGDNFSTVQGNGELGDGDIITFTFSQPVVVDELLFSGHLGANDEVSLVGGGMTQLIGGAPGNSTNPFDFGAGNTVTSFSISGTGAGITSNGSLSRLTFTTVTVPEPSSALLLGLAGLGLLGRRKRA